MYFYPSTDMSEVDFNELGSSQCFQSRWQALLFMICQWEANNKIN